MSASQETRRRSIRVGHRLPGDPITPKIALAMIDVAIEEAGSMPTTSGRRTWYPFRSRAEWERAKRERAFKEATASS